MMRRFWAVLIGRNKEFLRDRGALGRASACSVSAQRRPMRIAQAMTIQGACVTGSSPFRAPR